MVFAYSVLGVYYLVFLAAACDAVGEEIVASVGSRFERANPEQPDEPFPKQEFCSVPSP